MNSEEQEFDDYPDEVWASKEAFLKRFRIVEGEELAELKRRIARARSSSGSSGSVVKNDIARSDGQQKKTGSRRNRS